MPRTAIDIELARYRRDGMPEETIKAYALLRIRGDRKWEEGRREASAQEHAEARRLMLAWYKSVGKEPPK